MLKELAQQRAVAVKNALIAAGAKESQIEMKKPEKALADGKPPEARRVEVKIQ